MQVLCSNEKEIPKEPLPAKIEQQFLGNFGAFQKWITSLWGWKFIKDVFLL